MKATPPAVVLQGIEMSTIILQRAVTLQHEPPAGGRAIFDSVLQPRQDSGLLDRNRKARRQETHLATD